MCEVTSPDLKRLRAVRLACGGAVAGCRVVGSDVLLVVTLMVGAEGAGRVVSLARAANLSGSRH